MYNNVSTLTFSSKISEHVLLRLNRTHVVIVARESMKFLEVLPCFCRTTFCTVVVNNCVLTAYIYDGIVIPDPQKKLFVPCLQFLNITSLLNITSCVTLSV